MLSSAGEHRPYKAGVTGSKPVASTTLKRVVCGRIAKWPNAADCKSAPSGSVVQIHLRPPPLGCGQAVRQQTLTLLCTGSIPVTPAISSVSSVVEHLTFNQGVDGSSPSRGTTSLPGWRNGRRKGLKILRANNPYRFESGPGHQE